MKTLWLTTIEPHHILIVFWSCLTPSCLWTFTYSCSLSLESYSYPPSHPSGLTVRIIFSGSLPLIPLKGYACLAIYSHSTLYSFFMARVTICRFTCLCLSSWLDHIRRRGTTPVLFTVMSLKMKKCSTNTRWINELINEFVQGQRGSKGIWI